MEYESWPLKVLLNISRWTILCMLKLCKKKYLSTSELYLYRLQNETLTLMQTFATLSMDVKALNYLQHW